MARRRHHDGLSAQQVSNYLSNSGRCPVCGSGNIEGSHMEADCDSAWQNVTCQDCEANWDDIYRLVGVELQTENAGVPPWLSRI